MDVMQIMGALFAGLVVGGVVITVFQVWETAGELAVQRMSLWKAVGEKASRAYVDAKLENKANDAYADAIGDSLDDLRAEFESADEVVKELVRLSSQSFEVSGLEIDSLSKRIAALEAKKEAK